MVVLIMPHKPFKGLCFASQNIRSLTEKHDSIRILLKNSNVDLLALNETFLTDHIDNAEIACSGCSVFRADRDPTTAKLSSGGIAVYTKKCYDFSLIEMTNFARKM